MIISTLHPHQRQMQDGVLQHLARQRMVERFQQRDASLWYPAPDTQARIRECLGWLEVPSQSPIETVLGALHAAIAHRRPEQIVYVAPGMVGRSARLWLALRTQTTQSPRIVMLDTVNPAAVQEVLQQCDRRRSLVVHAGSFDTPQARALATVLPTDLAVPLPPAVGDRFGALTAAALAPAALQGLELQQIVDAAANTTSAFFYRDSSIDNDILNLGVTLGVLAQAGHDLIKIVAPPSLMPLAHWIRALVAGALSKHRCGFVPVITTPSARAAQARLSLQLVSDHAELPLDESIGELESASVPTIRCTILDRANIAAQVMTWQLAVSVAAMVIGVNPFDAPDADVINGRITDHGKEDRGQGTAGRDESDPGAKHVASMQMLHSLLGEARFLVLAAYLPETYDSALQALCAALSATLLVPITLVYPLRDAAFSLQLLHAGRPGGVVLSLSTDPDQITHDQRITPLVVLQRTQLAVELETWRRMRQPHVHLALGSDIHAELKQLLSAVSSNRQRSY